jgi:hypothetical protein
VQIYEDNPADYYVGNSLLLSDGTYYYSRDGENISFTCYTQDNNHYLQFLSNETYVFNEQYGAYIKDDNERLYYVFSDTIMTGELNQQFDYSKVILDTGFLLDEGEYSYDAASIVYCVQYDDVSYLLLDNLSVYKYDDNNKYYMNEIDNQIFINIEKEDGQYEMVKSDNSNNKLTLTSSIILDNIFERYFKILSSFKDNSIKFYVPKQSLELYNFVFVCKLLNKTYLFNNKSLILSFLSKENTEFTDFFNISLGVGQHSITIDYAAYGHVRFLYAYSSTSVSYWKVESDGTVSLQTETDTNNFAGYYVFNNE